MIKIGSNIHTFKMSPYSENKSICESGDIVTFETLDCFCNCFLTESAVFGVDNPKYSNPATGPLYIKNARCGDTLKIEIMDIQLGNTGVLVTGPVNRYFEDQ